MPTDAAAHPKQNQFDAFALGGKPLSKRSLVLEDNAIIGMEAESQLLDLGAEVVDVASTVARAMELIANHAYEFVLLDVNLGNETSRHAAEALRAAGIPHAFSTGYGEVSWGTTDACPMPVLTKPFETRALEHAVEQARRITAAQNKP